MARDKARSGTSKDLGFRYVSLRDAIGNVINLQAMLVAMKMRRDSLAEQINATHSETLSEALSGEQDALRNSVMKITTLLEKALDVFEKSEVVVNGKTIPFLEVIPFLQRAQRQALAFKEISQGMKIDDLNMPHLTKAKIELADHIKHCQELWFNEFSAMLVAIDATMVSETDVRDLDVSYAEVGFELEAEWTGSEWMLHRGTHDAHSSTADYLERLREAMSQRTCPAGTVIQIKIQQTRKGIRIESNFGSKTKPIVRSWYVADTGSSTSTDVF